MLIITLSMVVGRSYFGEFELVIVNYLKEYNFEIKINGAIL